MGMKHLLTVGIIMAGSCIGSEFTKPNFNNKDRHQQENVACPKDGTIVVSKHIIDQGKKPLNISMLGYANLEKDIFDKNVESN